MVDETKYCNGRVLDFRFIDRIDNEDYAIVLVKCLKLNELQAIIVKRAWGGQLEPVEPVALDVASNYIDVDSALSQLTSKEQIGEVDLF